MILTSNLKLDQYSDITIYDNHYDDTDDAVFVCAVDFIVIADENGLSYDIQKVHTMHLEYSAIMYTDENTDDASENIQLDLNDYVLSIDIEKSEEKKSLTVDMVDIDINKKTVKLYFIN